MVSDARDAYRAKQASKTRADKIKDLEQSVGSLNRRVENAIKAGDTDKVKDLRSRQKSFVKDLDIVDHLLSFLAFLNSKALPILFIYIKI